MTTQEQEFQTPEEVAEKLGHISPFTIRRLAAAGEIPVHRVPPRNKVVLDSEDVKALVAYFKAPVAVKQAPPVEDDNVFGFTSRGASRAKTATAATA